MIGERRKKQIESILLRAVQQRMARGLSDPRVRGLITVTRVELTDDGKRARAYVTVMPAEHAELTLHGLKAATAKLRRDVMDLVHLRDMPALEFVYDEGLKAQMEVMSLLTKDKLEREARENTANDRPGEEQG
ncbi:MAG: 30S ribosome-binding factor RbfA [Planctomycetota bacterium]|nr:MAG: 30S ribosome-binding factor RbfA [Planctomycetota bacterium]